jgi:hypothetical protein
MKKLNSFFACNFLRAFFNAYQRMCIISKNFWFPLSFFASLNANSLYKQKTFKHLPYIVSIILRLTHGSHLYSTNRTKKTCPVPIFQFATHVRKAKNVKIRLHSATKLLNKRKCGQIVLVLVAVCIVYTYIHSIYLFNIM